MHYLIGPSVISLYLYMVEEKANLALADMN
jgi:hypothetical protein